MSRYESTEVAQLLVLASQRQLVGSRQPRRGLADAMVRGVLARENLEEVEGGSVSGEEARSLLGNLAKQAVLDRYQNRRLLGWRDPPQNAVRFPVWPFAPPGLLPGLEEVLAILRSSPAVDDWAPFCPS